MKQGDLFSGVEPEPQRASAAPAVPSKPARPASRRVGSRSAATGDRPSDDEARRLAVTGFDRPMLLEAGAGTGKTATLVARVVHWCLGAGWDQAVTGLASASDVEPEEVAVTLLRGVAAITFTEAAAAEMSTRVGRALAQIDRVAATGELDPEALPKGLVLEALPSDPAVLRERARATRAALDHLNVSTIHAFCRRLLAAHPLEVGFDPAFEVDATFSRLEAIVREVLEAWLRDAWSEGVDADLLLLARNGVAPTDVEEAVVGLVEEGARAADFADDPIDDATLAGWHRDLGTSVATVLQLGAGLSRIGSHRNAYHAYVALQRTEELVRATTETTRAAMAELCRSMRETWNKKAAERLDKWAADEFTKEERTAVELDVAAFVDATRRLAEVVGPLRKIDLELLDCGRRVVQRLMATVETELRRRGVATFADLLAEAARLLTERPAVAARERRRLQQLLVDEFQDTDMVQCAVVAALGLEGPVDERPCLFLVGDPKQSIFAWRNADLAAYDALRQRVVDAGGTVLDLTCNFRSRAAILDEVERAVRPTMHADEGVQPAFVALETGRKDAPNDHRPEIETWLSWTVDAESGRVQPKLEKTKGPSYEVEARALAADVLERKQSDDLEWKDFAVLFRALTEIEPYLEELRKRGIPYEVLSDRKYYKRREVVDATALVRCVLDPLDGLALVTLLRSPMVGVPDAAILPLWEEELPGRLARLVKPDPAVLEELAAVVRHAARRVPADLPGLDDVRGWEESLVRALFDLAHTRAAFRSVPTDAWIEDLRARFLPEGVESARYLGAYRVANLERFFRDLGRSFEETGRDAHAVLRTLRANLGRDDRSEAVRPGDSGRDAVRILTIHGAKGLEFGHVYLAQTHKDPPGDGDTKTAFDRRGGLTGYALFGVPTPNWFRTERLRKQAEAAERVRLLYVALTRAKDRLIVLGARRSPPKSKPWDACGNFADLLESRPAADVAVAELARRVEADDAEPWIDETGALWRVPALGLVPDVAGPVGEDRSDVVPDPDSIQRESRALTARRAEAALEAARPRTRAASQESHAEAAETIALRRFAEGPDEPHAEGLRVSRDAAQAVGTALHAVLEELDLAGDVPAQLPGFRASLEARLRKSVDARELADATARAQELFDRVASNGLLDRLIGLREHVVAKELPVLLPPAEAQAGEAATPVGFVSGAIDLLYRDPGTNELVVADYKTDLVASDAELDERVALYRGQGDAYVAAVRDALGLDRAPRFELWFLATGTVRTVTA